jgi:hypothetical protein
LKIGGLFALSEAVERKTFSLLSKLRGESASPHEGRLNPQMLIKACMESGKISHSYKNNSVALGLLDTIIDFFPVLQENKVYLKFITVRDQLTIKTLGHISSLFDAGAYFIIFEKT